MKSNKELVYEFIQKCSNSVTVEEAKGVSTQYLATRLGIQRTNISSILNILVKEGCIEKINGRPVLYRIKKDWNQIKGEQSCFNQLIGCDGSLKNAVQLAKAAILYPQRSLHSLILGQGGSGKSYFADLMYNFAKDNKIIQENSPFINVNCFNYNDNLEEMNEELFGTGSKSLLAKSEGGILFIDNIQLLPANARNSLIKVLENNYLEIDGTKKDFNVIIICAMNDATNKSVIDNYSNYFSIRIQLLPLSGRSLEERFQMIQKFFAIEAERSNKAININPELLTCLLLYDCELNVKQLKKDIQLGCANAYVREYYLENDNISVLMSDFPYYIRTGLLNLKNNRTEIKEIIVENCNYIFSKEEAVMVTKTEKSEKKSMYDWIDEKVNELRDRGIEERDVNTIISINIENEFKRYSKKLSEAVIDKEQLSQIVNSRIIKLVSDFLEKATIEFNKVYPVSVFYGLCLHLDSTLNRQNKTQRLNNEQIMEIIKQHGNEYAYCVKFISLLEQEFKMRISIDEVIFITMFITKDYAVESEEKYPVVLIALHGEAAAKSIVEVVNFMSSYPAYHYDMPLNKSTELGYKELRELVLKIHKGKGIFAIYDMGSFKTMFDMISQETGIKIKTLEVPMTLIALDCIRKIMLDMDIDKVYGNLLERYGNIMAMPSDSYYKVDSKNIILTLCMSGEGAAIQTKKYIEKNIQLKDIEIIPLAISNSQILLEETNKLKENHNILCVIASYDPKLIGIKYIPISDIFQNQGEGLKNFLKLTVANECKEDENDDFEVIFNHLEYELNLVDVPKLKIVLPKAINEISSINKYHLTKDQEIALMVHVACCIQHMKENLKVSPNIHRTEIIRENQELYDLIKNSFALLEMEFKVIFDDNEIANIISIIKISKRG